MGPTPAPPMEALVVTFTEGKIRRWTGWTGMNWMPRKESFLFRLLALDWWGSLILLAVVTTLLLPLQWGGNSYPWSSGIVIGVFCAFGVLVPFFVFYGKAFSFHLTVNFDTYP